MTTNLGGLIDTENGIISVSDIAFTQLHVCGPRASRPIFCQPQKGGLFTYVSCEARVPVGHPLRTIRAIVDEVLEMLSPQLIEICANTASPSLTPEKLLRSLLLQAFYTVRSERQLIEQLGYNLLFRWFVGLSIDSPSWDVKVFTTKREQLLATDVAAQFLATVVNVPRIASLLSGEHFCLDRGLIEAWGLARSMKPREGAGELPIPDLDADDDLYGENGEKMPYYPARPRQ